jgi:hypothetical protein
MKVRRSPSSRNAVRFVGKFPSLKLDRTVLWGSQLERDFIYLMEFNREVISYETRPFSAAALDGVGGCYEPDFLIERAAGKQAVKISAGRRAADESESAFYRSIAHACRSRGYDFLLLGEETVREQPRLDNIKLLWRYARTPILPQHRILCADFMRRGLTPTLGEVTRFFQSKNVGREVVYALMYQGALSFELSWPITPDTTVSPRPNSAVFRRAS